MDYIDRLAFQTLDYIPHTIRKVRQNWIQLSERGFLDDDDGLTSEDVMDRLAAFMDLDIQYSVERLKMQKIQSMFSYDPFTDEIKKSCSIEVTPNFRYYISQEAQALRKDDDIVHFSLPPIIPLVVENVSQRQRNDIEQEVQSVIKNEYHCPHCKNKFQFTTPQIFQHRKQCTK